ncbi:hypothetical protein [Magnetospirillum sulfuroxidans]|uniref:Uncharacterized protein n=1 Tax=Magnetospirillum sulfuroxidans TaxID=611300 RepID=A0ABS5IEQ4_9PROT|nr:hypothetical protein [Magnetospirillum sulfuroxidans]MBR9972892.1 hypothetical protein [Magnetospirillum sulfuroxidans]
MHIGQIDILRHLKKSASASVRYLRDAIRKITPITTDKEIWVCSRDPSHRYTTLPSEDGFCGHAECYGVGYLERQAQPNRGGRRTSVAALVGAFAIGVTLVSGVSTLMPLSMRNYATDESTRIHLLIRFFGFCAEERYAEAYRMLAAATQEQTSPEYFTQQMRRFGALVITDASPMRDDGLRTHLISRDIYGNIHNFISDARVACGATGCAITDFSINIFYISRR